MVARLYLLSIAMIVLLLACSGADSATVLDAAPDAAVVSDPPDAHAIEHDAAVRPVDDGGPADAGADGSVLVVEPGPRLVADLSTCPVAFRTAAPADGINGSFVVSGQSRSFVLMLPPPSFVGPRPLFVGFNGTGLSGPSFASAVKLADFAARGFIVLAPSSIGNGTIWPIWDAMRTPGTEAAPNKDLEYFDALVGCVAAHYAVDATRVFVGGISAGGIFANKVLRARSALVAGGIVGSGVFSFTGNGTNAPLGNMFVIVTWGGDNDVFSGPASPNVAVSAFHFAEEAALASTYYASQPAVTQVHCRGHELGHTWLPINQWFIDELLTHPKGGSAPVGPFPTGLRLTCSADAREVTPLPAIACGATTRSGCQSLCQLTADCVAENGTAGPSMQSQLATLGFAPGSCGDCVVRCQQSAVGTGNAAALACFKTAQATAQCGPGMEGSLPFMNAVDGCCKGRANAPLCVDLCTSILQNTAIASLVPACKALVP